MFSLQSRWSFKPIQNILFLLVSYPNRFYVSSCNHFQREGRLAVRIGLLLGYGYIPTPHHHNWDHDIHRRWTLNLKYSDFQKVWNFFRSTNGSNFSDSALGHLTAQYSNIIEQSFFFGKSVRISPPSVKLEGWNHAHKSLLLASFLSQFNTVISSRPVSLRSVVISLPELLIRRLVHLHIVDGKYCLQKWTAAVNKYISISDNRKRGYPKRGGRGGVEPGNKPTQ
jgi:hypothetical protein